MSRKTTYRILGIGLMISFYLGLFAMFSMSYLGLETPAKMVVIFNNLVEEENECEIQIGDDSDAKIIQYFSFSVSMLQKTNILFINPDGPPPSPHLEIHSPPPERSVLA